jgi:hypothetical protein
MAVDCCGHSPHKEQGGDSHLPSQGRSPVRVPVCGRAATVGCYRMGADAGSPAALLGPFGHRER